MPSLNIHTNECIKHNANVPFVYCLISELNGYQRLEATYRTREACDTARRQYEADEWGAYDRYKFYTVEMPLFG